VQVYIRGERLGRTGLTPPNSFLLWTGWWTVIWGTQI